MYNSHSIVEYCSNIRIFMYSYNQDGKTPLYVAAYNGHKRAAKELIAEGANINQANNVSNSHISFVVTS